MAITFYYSPRSSATRCLWALEELGVPFEKVRVDLTKGDQKKPEFLAINPNGKVPAMVDGDAKLFESLGILFHLGDRYGVEKNLWPKPGTAERAEAYTWATWGTVTLMEAALTYAIHTNGDLHFALPPQRRDRETAAQAKATWEKCMDILEQRLERGWMVGSAFTLVDVANASAVAFGAMAGNFSLDGYKNVSSWLQRCQARPAFGRAMAG
jgi:glutathione S-transferase